MSSAAAVGWSPSGEAPAARARNARLILGLLGVIGVIIVVIMVGVMKKSAPPPIAAPKTAVSDPLAGVVDKMGTRRLLHRRRRRSSRRFPSRRPRPSPRTAPERTGRRASTRARGARGAHAGVIPSAAPGPTPVVDTATDRYRDTGPGIKVNPLSSVANRPPPSQAQITAVINNNRGGIKTCYQRALTRDNSLTHGKITVKLSLGISGRVKHINIDGPSQFRALEPCIKEVVSRWVFPQASEEYGIEFPLVFQGNE